jgi:hypothetical protein
MSYKSPNVPFLARSRFGAPLAALVLFAAACGGQSPADEQNAALVSGTTTNFVLTGIDAQTAAPFLTCATATSTTEVDAGTLAVGATTYTASFDGTVTQNGVTTAKSWQDKGKASVSGATYTFRSPGVGTFTGTLTNGTLMVVSDYTYCGATHTLTYQLQ